MKDENATVVLAFPFSGIAMCSFSNLTVPTYEVSARLGGDLHLLRRKILVESLEIS